MFEGVCFPNGKRKNGTYNFVNGSYYQGEFNELGQPHGKGKFCEADGKVLYQGEFTPASAKESLFLVILDRLMDGKLSDADTQDGGWRHAYFE